MGQHRLRRRRQVGLPVPPSGGGSSGIPPGTGRSARLGPLVPLPVPVPDLVAVDDLVDPWPFAGARLLPGRELAEAGLSDAARTAAARAVGSFLRALHDGR